ncbi:MAG TPA: asparagine synthase (glutamine-hydrolyzing) [Candidatus Sulfotelmatobacter sp.]|jgi:asparagine synthase (glutamine-hydrolysing)|nr:asparagine synthase (glutamine-hydrolyzing) [Candidatus Sulfotelmatobacter sp.]
MCGIAGLMTANGGPPAEAVLRAMTQAMAHRGPDGQGFYAKTSVGLAHCRLAIIDLVTGDQPLFASGDLALVANGEIYNHVELRAALSEVAFKTGSDCEPPLYLYQRHGLDFPKYLRGMYAIALHDPDKGRLVLSRDPFGIKPLYWAECAEGFLFASEPQAILATGLVDRRLRKQGRDELLNLQFTTGTETAFEGVHRLLPGETVAVEQGRIVERRRLDALVVERPVDTSTAALDRVLEESVSLHQRSDVPYGMFLSGGIDSSAVLALMARLNSRPVLAFTAFFPGTAARDESEHARELARVVGAEHVEVAVEEADFWLSLPAIAAHLDDPVADYAVVPTFKLAAQARKSVKVILSGEGGDELFAGYGRYRAAMRPWPFAKQMRRSSSFEGLGVLRDESRGWRTGYAASEAEATGRPGNRLQKAQAVDCADWLPNDLLVKLDRMLMAHGIEGRVPFLDREVARFAYNLPDRQKLAKGQGKAALRQWLAGVLPEARPFSPKRGFTVPVADWMAGKPHLGALVAASPAIQELCRPGSVETLFRSGGKKAGFAAWTLLFYALWHHVHVQGKSPQGDVFSVLSA